jgi:hypothetical protein
VRGAATVTESEYGERTRAGQKGTLTLVDVKQAAVFYSVEVGKLSGASLISAKEAFFKGDVVVV